MNYNEAKLLTTDEAFRILLWDEPNSVNLIRVLREQSKGRKAHIVWEGEPDSNVTRLQRRFEERAGQYNERTPPPPDKAAEHEEDEYALDSIFHQDNYLDLYQKMFDLGWDFAAMVRRDTVLGSEQAKMDIDGAIYWIDDALSKQLPFDRLTEAAQKFYLKARRQFRRWERVDARRKQREPLQ